MLLNHSLLSEEDFLVDVKRNDLRTQKKQAELQSNKNVKSDDKKKAVYDDYQSSVKFLKAGFRATKLNYSNSKTQGVIVFLSANGQNLCYKPK